MPQGFSSRVFFPETTSSMGLPSFVTGLQESAPELMLLSSPDVVFRMERLVAGGFLLGGAPVLLLTAFQFPAHLCGGYGCCRNLCRGGDLEERQRMAPA